MAPGASAVLRLAGRTARAAGARAYLVGGPVRDALLGRPTLDLDIAFDGNIRQLGPKLARSLSGRFTYHSRFLTGTVLLPDGGRVDVARTRTESYPKPAVLPVVRPAGIETDLGRRDFSINAMALELTPGRFGRLVDPHSGRTDLDRRLVRVLHSRSFEHDPTRIFRAIRFAVRLEFEIEPDTLKLMRAAVGAGLPGLLTPERVLYELRCFCTEEHAPRMFEAALREGLFELCLGQRPRAGFLAALRQVSSRTRDPELLFLCVLAALPDDPRFPVRRDEREAARAIRRAPALSARLARAKRPSTTYRLLNPFPRPALRVIAARAGPTVSQAIETYLTRLAAVEPLLRGPDLVRLGLRPGPSFRRILDSLRAARLDGRVRTREDEIALARRMLARRNT